MIRYTLPLYTEENLDSVATLCETPDVCKKGLSQSWRKLPLLIKENYISIAENSGLSISDCICDGAGDFTDNEPFWICGDICQNWYHVICEKIEREFAENISFYTCKACFCATPEKSALECGFSQTQMSKSFKNSILKFPKKLVC